MSKIKKYLLYSTLFLLVSAMIYLYIWEKPKLERFASQSIEQVSNDDSVPFKIKVGHLNLSIIPLQLELYDTELTPKKDLAKTLKPFKVEMVAARPSLIDLFIGKFWISRLDVKGSQIDVKIAASKKKNSSDKEILDFDLNNLLKRIPLSQINIQDVQLNLNYQDQHFVRTENLFLRAYNEKSSVIVTLKDPNLEYKEKNSSDYLNVIAELQVMLTKDTLSLSKIKIVKDSSYFLASGNILYQNSPLKIEEMQVKSRIKADFEKLKAWSNIVYKNEYFDTLKGEIKTDTTLTKSSNSKDYSIQALSDLKSFQVGKVKIGDVNLKASMPNDKKIDIDYIKANLSGNNKVQIENGKVSLGDKTEIAADIEIKDAQLQSFLKESGIADIPVWLNINGNITCKGSYEKKLHIDCPGALTVSNIKVQNASRTKVIVAAKKVDIAGNMIISESAISYKANAKLPKTQGKSSGIIDFDKGFNIKYETDNLDFAEIGPIGELKFLGQAQCKGSTQGDSRSAVFSIDIKSENFEFENYFFGKLSSKLNYKSGTLFFKELDGNIESTRFNGYLNVNLPKENIKGDIQLPFFRMEDIQQSIIKKVDLQNRFLGSGSGRLQLDTPFSLSQLSFILDARLFKGSAFGEDYNEAKLKAQAVDGIIIIQQGLLQKEKTAFNLKGTLDTDLKSQLKFNIQNGFLQHSSLIKSFNFPLSGQFSATGSINGPLGSPFIKTKANIKDLVFNKKKYGPSIFGYDNSKQQTNLQFNIPEKLEFLVVLPEENSNDFFIDLNAKKFDIAPLISYLVTDEATRSYEIAASGELSGKINTQDFWQSEFSSTIKEIAMDYKANKIVTKIPTNIEMKNNNLYLNELSLVGKKQYIKIIQQSSQPFSTKFIISANMNIAFFKLLAPFIEKIDGSGSLRLELSFNRNKLRLVGSSVIKDGFLKFPGFPHAFENLTTDIIFTQNKVRINSIAGELAGGKVIGDGEVTFKGGKNFDLQINTDMNNVNINFPEGFKTQGRANITLSGSGIPFLLSGRYNVTGGLIENNFDSAGGSQNTDLLEELLKKEISSPLLINLDINTENSVEVRNTLVEGYIEGQINVFDKITSPRIRGRAKFEDDRISRSVVRFNENEFEVTSSEFTFEGQSPINPKLSLRSETRLNGYDINLILRGRAGRPQLLVESQPPLPSTQIISMLALGQLPDQFQNNTNNSNDQNANSSFEIGTSLLNNNPLGKELKERLDVDVQFSSSFDDQNNAAVPKITVRKKFTKKLEASVSQATGASSQTEGRVSYELNNQLSAIFRLTNNSDDTTTNNNNNSSTRQTNPFGLDLEYRLEFD